MAQAQVSIKHNNRLDLISHCNKSTSYNTTINATKAKGIKHNNKQIQIVWCMMFAQRTYRTINLIANTIMMCNTIITLVMAIWTITTIVGCSNMNNHNNSWLLKYIIRGRTYTEDKVMTMSQRSTQERGFRQINSVANNYC